ncbi:MAG: hypothetical protein V1800_01145 [Candidatus Latescibacterota bacterium]
MPRSRTFSEPETLNEFLNTYTVPSLKNLAGLLTSDLPTRKEDLVAVIQERMEDEEELRKLWKRLDSIQQAAVAETVHSFSSHFNAVGFRAKYGENPDWGQIRHYGEMEKPSMLCLFIYNRNIPRDLKRRLMEFVPPPRTGQVRTVDAPPDTVTQSRYEYDFAAGKRNDFTEEVSVIRCETERMAGHDLHAVLRLIDAGKVRASEKTKRVSGAGATTISKLLQGGDFFPPEEEPNTHQTDPGPMKAFAWPVILQSAGLANLSGTKLQLTPAGKKALTSPPHKVIRAAWKRWLKTTMLDEFNRIQEIKGQTGKGKRNMTAAAGRRETIVEALRVCPPNRWIAFEELSRFMRASDYTFGVTRDEWSLYISDPQYGSLGYDGFGGWDILEERYIMVFLFEYAATMGLLDVAYVPPSFARTDHRRIWGTDDLDCLSRYDGLLFIRINGLGAWCLGLSEEYVPSPIEVHQVIKVLPNLDVVATELLPPGDVLFLEMFATQTADLVWRIQSPRLLKALEDGHSVGDVEAFLTARSGGSLPDNVAIFFMDMADRASHLTDRGPARLIEATDAVLAHLIVNDRNLRSLCMLAGERAIVIPEENERAFRRALRELGYGLPLPKL